jgi:hypothetical protein
MVKVKIYYRGKYCQAQSKFQLSWTGLALFSQCAYKLLHQQYKLLHHQYKLLHQQYKLLHRQYKLLHHPPVKVYFAAN